MIDLLFDNPIIIGVVIYFLWMLLKPSKAEKKKTTPQPSSQEVGTHPPYGKTKVEPRVERKTLTTNSQEHESRKKETLTQSNSSNSVQFDYAKEKRRLEERKKQAEEALRKINSSSSPTVQNVPKHAKVASNERFTKPNKQQLREGILWAEILSKPKAKRTSIK